MGSTFKKYYNKMADEKLSPLVIETFLRYYEKVQAGDRGLLTKSEIVPPAKENVISFNTLTNKEVTNLSKLSVIKLNGGLGTTMGLTKAKSLLPVKNELNFLDLIALQTLRLRETTGQNVPLILMNSFNTDTDTLGYLKKYPTLEIAGLPLSFIQNKFPKVRRDNLQPFEYESDPTQEWNPPGHGDIYIALTVFGILDKLIDSGIEYAFIANSDNLGATVDPRILNYLIESNTPFLMEVCNRLEIDKKGGHLAQDKAGQLLLREVAQCPENEVDEFQNIELYRYFNTNNIWVNLKAVKELMETENNLFLLPLILNPKVVDGTEVYQIETAMGAAISKFPNSKALVVPRERFAPVKKTSDLLTIWSDAYVIDENYRITLHPSCPAPPYVELDDKYYKTIDQIKKRFPFGAPSLVNCRSLKVEGDHTFDKDFICSGDVTIDAD
ncbi:MAG: UTP--glucose-1-phosphate uridylyltransferase [Candidatus Cloacimonadia bacterium]